MSVRIMSQVWGLDLPDSEMLIMLALADWSNDDGECWPSIAQLVKKTRKGERTIQGAIKSMAAAGHLTRHERPGKGCNYTLHPRSDCTPAAAAPRSGRAPAKSAPPQPLPVTPAAAADNTSGHTNTSSEALPPTRNAVPRDRSPFPRPDWADAQVWADFLANRKRKGLANTATAHRKLIADIDRIADGEWPPGRLLEAATAKGWGAIYPAIKEADGDGRRDGNQRVAGNDRRSRSGHGRTVDAGLAFVEGR